MQEPLKIDFFVVKTTSEYHYSVLTLCLSDSLSHYELYVAPQPPLSMGFSRQEYWVGCHALLQEIFSTQEWNPRLLHCRWILYHLSHQGVLLLISLGGFLNIGMR